ncbi:MAG: hypothetical protein JGK03_15465 [Microcoleus sp. PH2017_25_DOB_D_A]|uniref:hypothetical protein n=1 Tax=unclassified Microcoleus TaxID=2642155 RepID=UPI001D373438|nr:MULTISPECIES: hypothetical protein [unclassified Microcoleus]MCC3498338.1 hypothetical protein [Microcoleus sp. PH2017_15_JOR_U_A]MCC3509521.1 hypothetical protein [Microcoleus sp. PH2017_17_BER_D_A]MCC3535571.1 hypothetical protein [Microcoleus sp. PH2017_25_DOB_D_A]MCC3545460.1 hypothetical protein [Microcoleus sp. PH2017_24_DOB_U_A]
MKLPKLPWQKSDNKDETLELYRKALAAYADPANWSDVSCYGHLKPRRWKGGGDGADLARVALQQTENSAELKLTKED